MTQLGTLTHKHLRRAKACLSQQLLFQQVFPNGFVPNAENFLKTADVGLDVAWAVDEFLPKAVADPLLDRAITRRWGVGELGYRESFSHSVAHIWWLMIQEELTAQQSSGRIATSELRNQS